jgi:hypothetical protein
VPKSTKRPRTDSKPERNKPSKKKPKMPAPTQSVKKDEKDSEEEEEESEENSSSDVADEDDSDYDSARMRKDEIDEEITGRGEEEYDEVLAEDPMDVIEDVSGRIESAEDLKLFDRILLSTKNATNEIASLKAKEPKEPTTPMKVLSVKPKATPKAHQPRREENREAEEEGDAMDVGAERQVIARRTLRPIEISDDKSEDLFQHPKSQISAQKSQILKRKRNDEEDAEEAAEADLNVPVLPLC